jgi:hypothetical protein
VYGDVPEVIEEVIEPVDAPAQAGFKGVKVVLTTSGETTTVSRAIQLPLDTLIIYEVEVAGEAVGFKMAVLLNPVAGVHK